jgi:hypothetical protein
MRWLAPPLIALFASSLSAVAAAQPPPVTPPAPARPEPEPESREDGDAAEEEQSAPDEEPSEAPPPKATPLPGDEVDADDPEPPLIPPAYDTLAGHVSLAASALWAVPFGSLQDGVSQSRLLESGPGLGAELALGVSRTVSLGVWGQLLTFGDSDDCPTCSSSSFGVGAFVRYHLVQGTRFDPWMSAGAGYRRTSIEDFPGGDVDYSGIEWLRLQVGGDWYPVSVLGIGPLLELDMGIYSDRSGAGAAAVTPEFDQAAHWQLIVGAQIRLDIPGRY